MAVSANETIEISLPEILEESLENLKVVDFDDSKSNLARK